jgi:cytoskeleton protein RodZ
VGSFGEKLQREREMRVITPEEIAEATKIGTRSLRALEQQEFDKLPGGIFNKGFVRAYSRYLGIDEEQAVADYVAALAEAQTSGKMSRAELAPDTGDTHAAEEEISIRIPWVPIFALCALIVAVYAGQKYYAQHGWPKLHRVRAVNGASPMPAPQHAAAQPASTAPAPATTGPAAPTPQVPPTSQRPVAAANPAALLERTAPRKSSTSADGFVLRIRAREDAWISLAADGGRATSGVMTANTEKTIHAQREVILKTGNAGGIEISLNDKPLPPLGGASEVRTVTIGPEGARQ